jgi:hypothetical protein
LRQDFTKNILNQLVSTSTSMHTPKKMILVAALLATALSVQAQVLSDFSSGTNWGSPVNLAGGSGTFQISGGVGNYHTNGAPTGSQFSYMQYTGTSLSYDTSWSIRVDVNYATPSSIFTTDSQQFINLGLMVTPGSATPGISGGAPTFDGFLVSSNLFSTTSETYNRGFQTSIFENGDAIDGTEGGYLASVTAATFTAVILSYDAGTKMLTAGFDGNTTNGYNNFALPSQSVNVNTLWGMTGSDTFSLYLFGNSGWDEVGTDVSPTIGLGGATFDNLSAIPEPSTYAAMFGALALGLAAWRRRARAVAAV